MTIDFVAGEVSADNHGAALMRSLRKLDPGLTFIGRGGPQMQEIAGKQFKNWIGDAAVLGLWEVLRKYGYSRIDRLPWLQFAACPRIAETIATTKDNLLHQSAGVGLESRPYQKNGALCRSSALHFSV